MEIIATHHGRVIDEDNFQRRERDEPRIDKKKDSLTFTHPSIKFNHKYND